MAYKKPQLKTTWYKEILQYNLSHAKTNKTSFHANRKILLISIDSSGPLNLLGTKVINMDYLFCCIYDSRHGTLIKA